MTLAAWLDQWLENIAGTIRPTTLHSYRSYADLYIKPILSAKPVSKITAEDVQKMYARLKQYGRVRKHPQHGHRLSDSMVHSIHTMFYGAMKAAAQARLIAQNPVDEVPAPKPGHKPMQVLNEEQLDTFLDPER